MEGLPAYTTVPPRCFHHLMPSPWLPHTTNTCVYITAITLVPILPPHSHIYCSRTHSCTCTVSHNTLMHTQCRYENNKCTQKLAKKQVHVPCTLQTSLPWHTTPASSACTQLWMPHPLKGHRSKDDSEPAQSTSSIQMVPVPWPNSALVVALTVPLYPSCLHTTWVHAKKMYHLAKAMLFFVLHSTFI